MPDDLLICNSCGEPGKVVPATIGGSPMGFRVTAWCAGSPETGPRGIRCETMCYATEAEAIAAWKKMWTDDF